MHTVIETRHFQRAAKQAGLTDADREAVITLLADAPDAGDLIQGTGGARKLRFGPGGRGKSGGVRVITFYCAEDVPVFLLDVFSKGQKMNLSNAERNELKTILDGLATDYRRSASTLAANLRRPKS
ncbi:type II toxin-antitoxin system RelE/ParE family toxin [Hyphomonadaceae bacterium ML37]|nr:type II toxin-antitoxin system RelE/ParE family toxin [Hyphomonadaceae bacterium ML37]